MKYHKCETANKENITPLRLLQHCERNYYRRGGKERMADYYKHRITPEQKEKRRLSSLAWNHRNPDRRRLLRIASNSLARIKARFQGMDAWDIMGCNVVELGVYLDMQCHDGLDWRKSSTCEVDHIIPLCAYDTSEEEQARECLHFTNLQILRKGPHAEKSLAEHRAFMEQMAREFWIACRAEDYPGFKAAWRFLAVEKCKTKMRG